MVQLTITTQHTAMDRRSSVPSSEAVGVQSGMPHVRESQETQRIEVPKRRVKVDVQRGKRVGRAGELKRPGWVEWVGGWVDGLGKGVSEWVGTSKNLKVVRMSSSSTSRNED